ncbi:hypothetical protein BDN70DRAFT_399452 [Pholiota conissans]|uniref:Uncharacterized protein n=1 Tax=Pholiota conissans TaxID=109636 RepID=A0A9P5Z9I9_9AGAR|nr:hypothetical protein BDN70DRAFT_399452 [Pholiota conissans]
MAPNTRSPKQRLAFREKIVGKGVTTDALLKKLNTLHKQLAALEQETVDTNSLNTARGDLINTSLLLHKDRGVKAFTACCLADILRLYAPEAPYTQHELRDIFQFFFRQLSAGFKGTDEPYFNEYFHLIESLSTVKSVVLVCDLPSAEELLHDIFRDLFTIVKRNFTKKVEILMADILVALIDECNSLPSDALEIIMAQFVEKNALSQPGYRLAVTVCNAAADRLQRHVAQYFGDLLTSLPDDEDADATSASSATAHDLVKRLHRACPGVLHSVIPLLEAELRADGLAPRLIATQTLGEMYAAEKSGPELMRKYPATWATWLGRKADIAVPVRLKCIESVPPLIANLPEAREALEELLKAKIYDPDDKVRAAACKIFSQLDYEGALHHVSEEQLRAVAGRGLDKKRSVRVEALNSIGKLYSLAWPEIENNNPAAINQFGWIPGEVLQMTSTNSDVRALVEQILLDYILPLPSANGKDKEVDVVAWTDRLLGTMRFLEEKPLATLMGLSGIKSSRPNIYDAYLESCIKNNGGIIDGDEEPVVKKLKAVIQHLSAGFPEPVKATEDFQAFAKLNENRLYKLLGTCMDPQTDIKGLIKAQSEFLKRTEQLSSGIVSTMTIFLRRASYSIINTSFIPTLLKCIQKSSSSSAKAQVSATGAHRLMVEISKHAPALYKPHIGELCKVIAGSDEKGKGKGKEDTKAVESALMALANVVKWNEKLGSTIDKKTNERIMNLAMGEDWRQAKFAARYLAFCKSKATSCSTLVESIADAIAETDSELPASYVAALAQLARFAPDAFEQKSDVIMPYLIKRIIMVPSPVDPDDEDPDIDWIENEDVDETLRAKLLALKVCRNRCLAHAESPQALEIATPVLRLLATLAEHEGTLNPEVAEERTAQSRLRLQAAVSLLHLSTVETFSNAISPKFIRLAAFIQDPCYEVRNIFLTKAIALLQPRKLPPKFNLLPFLTLLDPEPASKIIASAYVANAKSRMPRAVKVECLEMIFIRYLHLLAHHPDYGTGQPDEIVEMAGYIQFYLDLIASSENISLLYHLAQKGKTVRDPESHGSSQNFYIMCEVAQILIKARAQQNSWLLASYPGKVRLPADILRPLPNVEATNQILKTVYLSEQVNSLIIERLKLPGYKEQERKEKERVPTKRKANTSAKANGTVKYVL